MQKLRKLLPIIFALVLIVATVAVLGIAASADTTTVSNVWLVSTPHRTQRAYANQKVIRYDTGVQSTNTTNGTSLTNAQNFGWGNENVIQYAAIGNTAYSSNGSGLTVTVAKIADGVDKAAIDKLWGLPVTVTFDSTTKEVLSVAAMGNYKIITSERIDAVSWDGGSAFFIDGQYVTQNFNTNGHRWVFTASAGGYFTGSAMQVGTGLNSGTITTWQNHENNSSNARYATAAQYAPDIVRLADTDNNGTYDWIFLQGVTRGTATAVTPNSNILFTTFDGSTNGNALTVNNTGGTAWLTSGGAKHYKLNGGANDTGAEIDGEYYIMPLWTTSYSIYEMWEVGNAVSDLRVEAKSGNITSASTASDLNAYVTVYGTAEAIATITDVSYNNTTGVITVTATYLDETETWSQFIPSGIAITSAPAKTSYQAGDAIDTTGMVVAVTFDNGTVALDLAECTVTAVANPADPYIRVSYQGFEASTPISVIAPTGIIVTPPTKLSYESGEAINTAGMTVALTFSGTEETTPIDLSECTITQYASYSNPVITVTYGDYTETIDITVTRVTVTINNVWLIGTPYHSFRAYSGNKFTYYGGAQQTGSNASQSLTWAYNNGWGADNVIQFAVIGNTAYSSNGASLEFTVLRLDSSLDKSEVDKLWGVPVVIEAERMADGVYSAVSVEVAGTLKVVTTDRVDAHNANGSSHAFFFDGHSIDVGFNTAGHRWSLNTSSGGFFEQRVFQGNTGFASGAYPESTSNNPRWAKNATYAPDIAYFVDMDNNGNNDFEWCFLRPVTRGTTTVVDPGTAITFSIASTGNSSNGNDYTLPGNGGSAWLTGNTGKHYKIAGGAFDTGASVGTEYYVMINWGYNASGFNGAYYDLYPVGDSVDNTFSSLTLTNTSFTSLDGITTDMIEGHVTVFGVAEAKATITGVEVTGEEQITVTGEYLGETVTGTIDGIAIKSLVGIEFTLVNFVNSASDVTVSDLIVYKVYDDDSREIAGLEEIDSIEAIGDNDDTIRVVLTDATFGGSAFTEGKLWHKGDYYISATKTKNHRLTQSGLTAWTVKAGNFTASNMGNIALQSGFTGDYVNLNTAFAISPIDGARPSDFTLVEYSGNYNDIESHYMMPVTAYFGDAACTALLFVEFNENDADVISTRDIHYAAGQYYVGADAVSFDEDATLYFRGNGQYIVPFSVSAFLNNCANGTYANAGNVYALDSDGDGDYDWLYYEPIYYVEGVAAVGTGAGGVPSVQFVEYTRNGGMPAEADSSVYNWFKSGLYRYGNHGGTITSGIAAGETNYYFKVYLDTASGSAPGSAYYIMYAEDGVNGRYYPTTLEATTTTVAKSYLDGATIPVADLPAIHIVRNDGSAANIKLTAEQVNNAAELVVTKDTESLTVNATVDGRTFEFTISGFTVTNAPTEVRVTVQDGVTFRNGDPILKSYLTVEADFEVKVGRITETQTRTISSDDYTLDTIYANIEDPYVRVTHLGVSASAPITVVQNVQNLVLVATYTNNIRPSDNGYAAPAANTVAFTPLGEFRTSAGYSTYNFDVHAIADGVTVSDDLVMKPVAVEFNADGELISIAELGTHITFRASDLTMTYDDVTGEYEEYLLNGVALDIDESIANANGNLYNTSLLCRSIITLQTLPVLANGNFTGDNDEIVYLYDTDNDGDYDFASSIGVINGAQILDVEVKEYNNVSYNVAYLGGSVGSYGSTGWFTYSKGNYVVYELADGVEPLVAGDYVNYIISCDASLPYENGVFRSGGHNSYPVMAYITSKSETVEGLVSSVEKSVDYRGITFKIGETDYKWSNAVSTYDYADGANLQVCGRSTFANNGIYTLVLDEAGNVVRTLASTLTVEDVDFGFARGKSIFISGKDYTDGQFEVVATLSDGNEYPLADLAFSKTAPEIGDASITVTVLVGGVEYEDTLEITVIGASLTKAYFQITSGTTAGSASTNLRFVAGISDLDHAEVGYVFSLTDSVLDIDFLESEDFEGLKWTVLHEAGGIKLQRARYNDNTYFKIITKTVYDSVLADGVRVTAADLNSNYLFACTFTGVPNSYFNNVFTARAYTKTRLSAETSDYDFEYSSTLTSYTITEMIG